MASSIHDIFLSHSGKQKGFVMDLLHRLEAFYTVFFDITDHSLPPADKFPPRIFEAARNRKLAVVVLSNDFVVSYWPMLELCAFVRAAPSIKILPLFYHLSPSDLKNDDNLDKWRKAWHTYAAAQSNSKHPLDVMEWEKALTSLCSLNGIIFNPSIRGEQAYLDEIVSKISKIVPPAVKYEDSGIHGKERLCNAILAEFAKLELRAPQPRVCILGMYGLPGSGKSTLCKCLCNHYFPYIDGKAIYIDLPKNPTSKQLAEKCKELLNRSTNFRNMVDLTHASDIQQVYYVLRNSNLQSSPIFLVLDNISEETLKFVQTILKLGVGPGSKVLLVARTFDLLQSFLDPQTEPSHYIVSASLSIPSLDEKEAIRVLLQSLANKDLPDHNFSPCDRQIMEKVVRMSGFGTERTRLYLPLVMKIMGVQLRQYKLDVKQWGSAMDSFWTKVEKCKERAVMGLVQKSFLQLSKRLQLLFLDLALFIQRLSAIDGWNYDRSLQAWKILSIMHDCSPDDIIRDMYDLQRHCFVEGVQQTRIHDVYLEFAASIPESSMYYVIHRSCNSRYNVDYMLQGELPPPQSHARESGLRAVILELNEGQERFEFWPGFSNVKALVFRNCKKLAVLGFQGLTSLPILDIDNCPSLKSVEVPTHAADCRNLIESNQWLRWVNAQDKNNTVMEHEKSNHMVQMYALEPVKQVVNNVRSWFSGMIGASHIERPSRMEVGGFAFQMRWLQHLDLRNTGIRYLGNLSTQWPLLKEMTIVEKSLEHIEVGKLPYLKDFVLFCDDGTEEARVCTWQGNWEGLHKEQSRKKVKVNPRRFENNNLLVGCAALESVMVRSASLEDGLGTIISKKLKTLLLANFWRAEKLPNLGACAESLQRLLVWECGELRSADFTYRFERLSELHLTGCPSITEVSGLDCLPSLHDLYINNCINLQIVGGLSGLVSLKRYAVGWGCPNLQVLLSDLEGLTNLSKVEHRCNTLMWPGGFNVRNLLKLEDLVLCTDNSAFDTGANLVMQDIQIVELTLELEPLSICSEEVVTRKTVHCHTLLDLTTLLGVPEAPHDLSRLTSIYQLWLEGVQNLASLRGIEFLHPLWKLGLRSLQNLSCLQGIESLTRLYSLEVEDCASIEELPSLSQLVHMRDLRLVNCAKLRSIEGCGALTKLDHVVLIGCKSMACFPLDYTPVSCLQEFWLLRVEGSKFASKEVLVSWILDDEKPAVMQSAALQALMCELCGNLRDKQRRELAIELLERLDNAQVPAYNNKRILQDLLGLCEQVVQGNNNNNNSLYNEYDYLISDRRYESAWSQLLSLPKIAYNSYDMSPPSRVSPPLVGL